MEEAWAGAIVFRAWSYFASQSIASQHFLIWADLANSLYEEGLFCRTHYFEYQDFAYSWLISSTWCSVMNYWNSLKGIHSHLWRRKVESDNTPFSARVDNLFLGEGHLYKYPTRVFLIFIFCGAFLPRANSTSRVSFNSWIINEPASITLRGGLCLGNSRRGGASTQWPPRWGFAGRGGIKDLHCPPGRAGRGPWPFMYCWGVAARSINFLGTPRFRICHSVQIAVLVISQGHLDKQR